MELNISKKFIVYILGFNKLFAFYFVIKNKQ